MASGTTDPAAGRVSRPVVVAVILGVLLFAVLGGLVFKSTSPTTLPSATILEADNYRERQQSLPSRHAALDAPRQSKHVVVDVPPEQLIQAAQDSVRAVLTPDAVVKVDPTQPVASFVRRQAVRNAFDIDYANSTAFQANGELYRLSGGEMTRVLEDTFTDSDPDRAMGPMVAFLNHEQYHAHHEISPVLNPASTALAYDPTVGVLLMVFATEAGSLYGTRIRTPPNKVMLSDWERGTKWSDLAEILDKKEVHYVIRNPVLFYDEFAQAFRIMYTGVFGKQTHLYTITSTDSGGTWSAPWQLGTLPNPSAFGHVIRPSDQDYIMPIVRKISLPGGGKGQGPKSQDGYSAHALMSEDSGVSFHEMEIDAEVVDPGLSGPAMVRLTDGRLVVYLAQANFEYLRMKISTDGGKTWGPELNTDFPSSGTSHFTATVFNSGQVAVVFVNVLRRHNHAHSPLSIAISDDMLGKTFPFVRDLELATDGELGGFGSGFDSPSLVQTPNGLLHIAYTCKQHMSQKIKRRQKSAFVKYVAVDEAWVIAGQRMRNTGDFEGELVLWPSWQMTPSPPCSSSPAVMQQYLYSYLFALLEVRALSTPCSHVAASRRSHRSAAPG